MHVANAAALGFRDDVVSGVEEEVVVSRRATDGALELPPHPATTKPRETATAARPTTPSGNRGSLKRL
jgi:hypothetical protein